MALEQIMDGQGATRMNEGWPKHIAFVQETEEIPPYAEPSSILQFSNKQPDAIFK